MRHAYLLAVLGVAVAGVAGCIEGAQYTPPSSASQAASPPITDGDIPCDVAAVLVNHCGGCHNPSYLSGGVDLTTYASLTAASKRVPSMTVAQRAVARMQDSTSPMPPTGTIASADIATVAAWVAAGTPKGACSTMTQPAPVTVQCSSGMTYSSNGDDGSKAMDPGQACIACHSTHDAPKFEFAGTVYPTEHEPDNCVGESGATVTVTDAKGATFTQTVGANGNFASGSQTPIAFPITAEIQLGGKTLKMNTAVPSGDCNSCHTVLGANGAPGRIVAP